MKKMSEARYIISDAAKKVSVEPHVLRYWEEELDLKIPRNEMGHRYYRERDIEMLKMVKLLKDKGYQLRAIKMEVEALEQEMEAIPNPKPEERETEKKPSTPSYELTNHHETGTIETTDADREERMRQFRMIMTDIIGQAIRENNQDLSMTVTNNVSETVIKEMDYLVREKEEREEARYQRLDELIREIQKNRAEAAATQLETARAEKKKKGFFRRK